VGIVQNLDQLVFQLEALFQSNAEIRQIAGQLAQLAQRRTFKPSVLVVEVQRGIGGGLNSGEDRLLALQTAVCKLTAFSQQLLIHLEVAR